MESSGTSSNVHGSNVHVWKVVVIVETMSKVAMCMLKSIVVVVVVVVVMCLVALWLLESSSSSKNVHGSNVHVWKVVVVVVVMCLVAMWVFGK